MGAATTACEGPLGPDQGAGQQQQQDQERGETLCWHPDLAYSGFLVILMVPLLAITIYLQDVSIWNTHYLRTWRSKIQRRLHIQYLLMWRLRSGKKWNKNLISNLFLSITYFVYPGKTIFGCFIYNYFIYKFWHFRHVSAYQKFFQLIWLMQKFFHLISGQGNNLPWVA